MVVLTGRLFRRRLALPRRAAYVVIVQERPGDTVIPAIREWLRSERRLGIPFWATGPLAAPAAAQPGRAAESPTSAPPRTVSPTRSAAPPARSAAPPPARPTAATAAASLGLLADATAGDLPPIHTRNLSPADAARELALLDEGFVRGCQRCGLHAGRTQTVFGVGNPRPELAFVGEGPGADEDRAGQPFVGRAGQLLTRMIAAMRLTREQVYICNVVKCRPPENRTPTDDEMQACMPFLFRQLAILRPAVIVALGRPASQTLLATTTPIGRLRGQFHDFPPPAYAHFGLPPARVMPTFHPAYLLRSPQEKSKAWEDLKQVMRFLGIPTPD